MRATKRVPVADPPTKRTDTAQVVRALGDFCDTLKPGDRVPTHTELMRHLGASERAVRYALDELQREGRIVRRNGVGTFVAEPGEIKRGVRGEASASLAGTRTIVALTVPDNSFFDRCMDQLFRYVESSGLSLVCQPVNPDALPSASALASSKPLGFILFRYTLESLAKQLQEQGCRAVIVGSPTVDILPEVPTVYGDHEYGGYLATKHLVELGHRRIAFAHAGSGNLNRQWRWRGHQRALREAESAGTIVESSLLMDEETDRWREEPESATAWLRRPDAPTALVAWNDHEAAALLACMTRAGVRVPEEISLIGYDDLPEGRLVYPPLTTIDHAMGQQLHAAVDLLTRTVPPPPSHTVIITPTLVRRESTAPPSS